MSYKASVLKQRPEAFIDHYEWSWTVYSSPGLPLGSGRNAMAAWKDAAANLAYKKGTQQRGVSGADQG